MRYQLAYIVPYAERQQHVFSNMIVLCRNCHFRYDQHEIDRKSMVQYKANLAVVPMRYSEFERRVLTWFIDHGLNESLELRGGDNYLTLAYLLRDGLLEPNPKIREAVFYPLRSGDGRARVVPTDRGGQGVREALDSGRSS